MAVEVVDGTDLPLNLTLYDGDTGKYPVAHVFKQDGTEVVGSPFNLVHVALGRYSNITAYNALLSDIRYTTIYRVFDDALHTEESYIYNLNTEDVFDVVENTTGTGLDIVASWHIAVPDELELPTSGSKQYRFAVYFFDAHGAPVDPDLDEVYVHIEDISNAEIITPALLTKEQTGVYWYKYTVTSIDFEQPLWIEFSFDTNSIPMLIGDVTETLRERAVLDIFETQRLTAIRCARIDNLDVLLSSRESEVNALTRYNTLLSDILINTSKIDAINALIGIPFGGTVASALSAIKLETDRIGIPVFTTLAGDNSAAYTQLLKIGTPVTGTVSGDIAAIQVKLGSPALSSVSADIAAIKFETDKIGLPASGTLAQDNVNLNNKIGTPVVSIATDINTVGGLVNNVNAKLGIPFTGTVSGDIADIDNEVDELIIRLSPSRASNLDYLNVSVASRASQASLDADFAALSIDHAAILAAIGATPNNTTFVGIVPTVLVLPTAGTKDYKFYVNLFDIAGSPNDADGNVTVTIKTVSGSLVVGPAIMNHPVVGRYDFTYGVNSTDIEQPLVVFFDYVENAIPFQQARLTEVQEFESKLDTLISRLTAPRAANLDNLDALISSRLSTAQAATNTLSINNNVDANETLINTILSRIGVPSISLVADIAAVYSYAIKIGIPVHGTLALDAVAIQTEVNKIGTPPQGTVGASQLFIENKIGSPIGTLASDLALIKAETDKIGSPLTTVAGDIADIKSTITGPLSTQISTVQSTATLIATRQGVPVTTIAGDIALVNTKLGTPVGSSVSADIAAIAAETDKIGSPVHGSLASDNIVMESLMNSSIFDIANLEIHLGTQDISMALIKAQTDKIGPSTYGTITADISNLNAKIGTPTLATIADDIAAITFDPSQLTNIENIVTDIQSEMGVIPGPGTVSSELLSIHNDLLSIPVNPLLNNDPRLNNLDAPISTRATPADVSGGGGGSSGSGLELVGVIDPDSTDYELLGTVELESTDYELIGIVEPL